MNNSENEEQVSDEDIEFLKYQEAEYEKFLKNEEARYENDLLRINEDRIKIHFQNMIKCSENTNNEKFEEIYKAFNIRDQIAFRTTNLYPTLLYDNIYIQFETIMKVQLEL